MQSESDSEGEFFDATDSQANSFDASSPISIEHKNDKFKFQESRGVKSVIKREVIQEKGKHSSGTSKTIEESFKVDKPQHEPSLESLTTEHIQPQHNNERVELHNVDNKKNNSKVKRLELDLQENINETDLLEVSKELMTSSPLTPVSEILQGIASGAQIGSTAVGGKEGDSPAPVAPPRRKRKKKPDGKGSPEAGTDKAEDSMKPRESPTPENPSSSVSTPEGPPDNVFPSPLKNLPSEQDDLLPVANSSLLDSGDDPVITLDYKSQEMNKVLEKAISTEVIHALTLDSRRKSHSVSSLGSSCTRSDSFASVSSVISNGPTNKSGSTASVGSPLYNHGDLVRVKSESGRPLSDTEILEQVIVKNLDTGESIPLSLAEDRLPKGTNPLALHIMRLTSEYSSNSKHKNLDHVDGVDVSSKMKRKSKKLKGFLGRTVNKMKAEKKAKEVQREDSSSSDDEDTPYIKIKSAHGKGPEEFEKLKLLQDLSGEHVGAIWTVRFSVCGRLMATAGQDHMVRVWVLKENEEYFEDMRKKYSKTGGQSCPPDPEVDQILEQDEEEEHNSGEEQEDNKDNSKEDNKEDSKDDENKTKKEVVEDDHGPFKKKPFCTYYGHTGDVLDLSWSKNYFLLSSSMDKTVRLWHISRTECLCCFQHIDFVTAIVFHPRDDRYFLSGSLDGKIRLWNIPDKKVALWNEVEGSGSNLITAANFCLQGRYAVVGTYDGRCIFYETERLKYHTQWQVRSSRNKRSRGRKISGIEPMPGEEKVLITSNDSRIRLYDLKDNSLSCKYKGCTNTSSQIKASFSHDGQYLICGSEDHFAYIWRTQHGIPSSRRDKNEFFESFSAHTAVVTVAIFAPVPWLIVEPDTSGRPVTSEVLVTADWTGAIKLFVNR